MLMPMEIDLLTPDAIRDPHALFREARAEAPAHWSTRHKAWVLTTYEEIDRAFRDPTLSTERIDSMTGRLPPSRREAIDKALKLLHGWMLFHDEPDHSRLRDPVRRAFSPRMVEGLKPRIEEIVASLLDEMAEKAANGERLDAVNELAFPLPALVIAELLGVPVEDRAFIRDWSRDFGLFVFGALSEPEYDTRVRRAGESFWAYFGDLIKRYEAAPADNLISALLAIRDDDTRAPGTLTTDEVIGASSLLLFAGHDTTTSLITSGLYHLLRNPDAYERVKGEPGLWAPAVEEFLRIDGPAKVMFRLAVEDHERAGVEMKAGDLIYVPPLAADHDPAVFADPDRLNVARAPNPHVAFGAGAHFCLGSALARLEGRIALKAFSERFPQAALGEDEDGIAWSPAIADRSIDRLRVSLGG